MSTYAQFVQLITHQDGLYALDSEGKVWRYVPMEVYRGTTRNAFWTSLTTFRRASDTTKQKEYE